VELRPDSRSWSPLIGLHDHNTGHTTFDRTPLDKWSARRKNLYLTTHKSHKRDTPLPPAGFEPTIPARQRLRTHAFHCAATRIGKSNSRRANSNAITEKMTLSTQVKPIIENIEEGKFGLCKLNLTGRQNTTPQQRAITVIRLIPWYSNSLRGWTVRGSNPRGGENFRTRPDRPRGTPSILCNWYRVIPWGKGVKAWRWPPTPSNAEVKERVDLYL
jgi:hypothetical protein